MDEDDNKHEGFEVLQLNNSLYYKSCKTNAVLNEDAEYVGIFDGKKIQPILPIPNDVKEELKLIE